MSGTHQEHCQVWVGKSRLANEDVNSRNGWICWGGGGEGTDGVYCRHT